MNKHFKRDAATIVENLGAANRRFSGKTILLTGGAGFLGTQFSHYFMHLNREGVLEEPCTLLCLDNYLRGTPTWMEDFKDREDFRILKADITKPMELPDCDFVIHAASVASPIFYRKHPIETMDANVIGLRLLLDHFREKGCESFLYFSTSEIYGDPFPEFIPTSETYRGNVSCTGPRACYDESKRYGETLCVNFHQQYGLPVKIARPFNNYGPGLRIDDGRVLPDFFNDVLNGRDIRMLSDGKATRTFCYITDAITGYLLILLSSHDGEPFNIGVESPEISMRDIADLVIRVSGSKRIVVTAQSPDRHYLTDNPQRRCPDISKARRMLGYDPNMGLEEGLKRTFEYYAEAVKIQQA
jgi:dTDP-glucose 4,6-dehydratase/UDP-glucuronate decarboxylase